MPQLGETVTEGTILRWAKEVGETISEDEVLVEISTDKVDTEVPSSRSWFRKAIPSRLAPSWSSSATPMRPSEAAAVRGAPRPKTIALRTVPIIGVCTGRSQRRPPRCTPRVRLRPVQTPVLKPLGVA
jgi:hypothetical protein